MTSTAAQLVSQIKSWRRLWPSGFAVLPHRRRDEFPCHDCGLPTAPCDGPDEWYTVHDAVWQAGALGAESIACIGCLESRLGRRLHPADFLTAPLNDPDYGNHSPRLRNRLRPSQTTAHESTQ
ncbi:hypothetical protein NBRGN_057_03180 [Nocardia brasiliensis NBRC 14402]|nr:hypothetical protein NBRGN_057_03180 [Nocardia brasiliensis NBRC 14402]